MRDNHSDYKRIEKVIHYLNAHHVDQPDLERLALVAGLSPFHFHRLFSRWAGTTPKSFLKFLTLEHAKTLLLESKDLLHTTLDTGLSSPSRLHDLFLSIEGVTPGEFKSGGKGIEIEFGFHPTIFGNALLGVTSRGICHLSFNGDETQALTELKMKWPASTFKRNQNMTANITRDLFTGVRKKKLSILLSGTPFQLKVWEALLRIPQGHVVSYKDVAHAIGNPAGARAVGSAVGQNTVAYLIPCHRVIRETGVLGDYRWGTDRKRALLAWEFSKI